MAGTERVTTQTRQTPREHDLPFAWQGLLLGLIVALAAAVRCATLSFQSLWLDEVSTVTQAGAPWGTLLLGLFTPQQGYPLYILFMRLWIAVCGTSEVALRLPSALAGTCAVPVLYLLGRRAFGWKAGLLAAALLALSPIAIWYSQEAKAYAAFVLLTLAAWLLLWEAVNQRTRWAWWAFAGVTVLALSTHRLTILSVVGQLAYVVYIARQGNFTRRHRLLLLALLVAALLVTLAGLWYVLGREGAGQQFGVRRQWSDLANTFTQFSLRIVPGPPQPPIGPDRRPWLIPFAVTALAGIAALVEDIIARGARRRRAVFLLSFLAVPLAVFYLLYLIRPFYYERYLLGTLPAYLLLLAAGVDRLWTWAHRLGSRPTFHGARPPKLVAWPVSPLLGLLALATALGLLAPSWQQVQEWTFSRLPLKEQYREATLYLQQHLHPGDLVVVHPGYIAPAVEFYAERFPRVPLVLDTITNTATVDYGYKEFTDTMDRLARGRRRACLLYAPYHAETEAYSYRVREWFKLNPFLLIDEQQWTGLELYCVSFNVEFRGKFPQPAARLNALFGQEMLLWGADVEPFQQPLWPGDTLPVTLYLVGRQGQQAQLPDLTVVVRLVSPGAERVWAEESRKPLGGHLPTYKWVSGDDFLDYHELLLPADIPPGEYALEVGFQAGPSEMLTLPGGSAWAELGPVEVAAGGRP